MRDYFSDDIALTHSSSPLSFLIVVRLCAGSGIYCSNDKQREVAEATARKVADEAGKDVIVEIKPEALFYIAEDYHQRYLEKGGQDASKGSEAPIRCYG